MNKYFMIIVLMLAPVLAWGQMHYPEADVTLESESGTDVTFASTASASKASDAENQATEGVFYALFTKGVDGYKNGQSMIHGDAKTFLYSFFNEKQYVKYLSGNPVKAGETKIAGKKQVTMRVTVRMKSLLSKVSGGGVTLNPAWNDSKKVAAPGVDNGPMQPTVTVYPYLKGVEHPSFRDMKNLIDRSPAYAHAVGEISSIFTSNGYKTRDFRTALNNIETSEVMNTGVQNDVKSMIVRALPGDIIVEVDLSVTGDGKSSNCAINLRGVEKQTEQLLAEKSYASGKYMTTDTIALVNHAMKKAKAEFFEQIKKSFERIVANGRTMALEFNIDSSVGDWDFSEPTPATDEIFTDALEDWLVENSFQGNYNMGSFTDKVILASCNIPLWDNTRNRSYSTSRFNADLKKFIRSQLGDGYKPETVVMGQKIVITIK